MAAQPAKIEIVITAKQLDSVLANYGPKDELKAPVKDFILGKVRTYQDAEKNYKLSKGVVGPAVRRVLTHCENFLAFAAIKD
jgi:hypothetical protein